MAPKRKAQRAASGAAKRRAVAPKRKVLAAVKEKASLSAAEADSLDYKSYNQSKLVLFENVSPLGFESSAYTEGCKGEHLVFEQGKMFCVEALDRSPMEDIADFLFSSSVQVTLGQSIRLTPDGSEARYAPLIFDLDRGAPLPPKSLSCNLAGDEWPTGVMSYGVSRTLPEHFEDGVALLNASADGGMGKGIRFYLGIHEYLGTGQLLAFVLERQKISAASSSNSIVMKQAVSFGTTGLSPSYQLVLPAEMVFDGDPIPRCFPSDGLKLDLFRVQSVLLRGDVDFSGLDACNGCQYCDG